MTSYCLQCKKATEDLDSKLLTTSRGSTRMASTCAECKRGKSKMTKKDGTFTPGSKKAKNGRGLLDFVGGLF